MKETWTKFGARGAVPDYLSHLACHARGKVKCIPPTLRVCRDPHFGLRQYQSIIIRSIVAKEGD